MMKREIAAWIEEDSKNSDPEVAHLPPELRLGKPPAGMIERLKQEAARRRPTLGIGFPGEPAFLGSGDPAGVGDGRLPGAAGYDLDLFGGQQGEGSVGLSAGEGGQAMGRGDWRGPPELGGARAFPEGVLEDAPGDGAWGEDRGGAAGQPESALGFGARGQVAGEGPWWEEELAGDRPGDLSEEDDWGRPGELEARGDDGAEGALEGPGGQGDGGLDEEVELPAIRDFQDIMVHMRKAAEDSLRARRDRRDRGKVDRAEGDHAGGNDDDEDDEDEYEQEGKDGLDGLAMGDSQGEASSVAPGDADAGDPIAEARAALEEMLSEAVAVTAPEEDILRANDGHPGKAPHLDTLEGASSEVPGGLFDPAVLGVDGRVEEDWLRADSGSRGLEEWERREEEHWTPLMHYPIPVRQRGGGEGKGHAFPSHARRDPRVEDGEDTSRRW